MNKLKKNIFALNNYHFFCFRRDNVLRLWNYLLELLRARRSRLEDSIMLQQTFQEMIYILDTMEEIKVVQKNKRSF